MSENTNSKKTGTFIFKLADETKNFFQDFFQNDNQKYLFWGPKDRTPFELLNLYDSVPEHCSAINFTEQLTTGIGLANFDELNFQTIQKIVLDELIFGGYVLKITKLRNGKYNYEYTDISKCRLSKDKKSLGYCEDWKLKYKEGTKKPQLIFLPLVSNINEVKTEAYYLFKNNKSRQEYPRPAYISALKSLDTSVGISIYQNNQVNNGFTPTTVLKYNGINDPLEQQKMYDNTILSFCGPSSSRVIVTFDEVDIKTLDNNNLSQDFEVLQKYTRNEITIAHQIVSQQLLGIAAENQGFSKTEYNEALEIFKEITINSIQKELEYSFNTLTNRNNILFIEKINIQNNNNNDTTN